MDFSDPLIRNMVARNHVPEELVSVQGDGKVTLHEVHCQLDKQLWPCDIIGEYREVLVKEAEELRIATAVSQYKYPPPGTMSADIFRMGQSLYEGR